MKRFDKKLGYIWLDFAKSFLSIAELACNKVLEDKDKKIEFGENYYFPATPYELFIPIVFNIKHSLEVFVKTFIQISVQDNKTGFEHDLKKLFDELIKKIPQDIRPIKDGRGNEITQEDVDNLGQNLEKIQALILKYYHCDFSKDGKRIVNIYDQKNDVFRYPDNQAEIKIDTYSIDHEVISQLKKDIDEISELFNNLGYIIDVWRGEKASPRDKI